MAMHSLGKVAVVSPGTPVQATINNSSPSARVAAYSIMFQALPGNSGKVYVGLSGLNKSTLTQCVAIIAVPTTNSIPAFTVTLTYAPGGLNVTDFYVDADNAQDGALISFVAG